MRSLYEPLDHKIRAAIHRKAAEECQKAGYPTMARVNLEMAEFLDPPVTEEDYY
jgi:hypothetical protein